MSLFGFGNIEFESDGREGRFGPLGVLEGNPEYQRENFRYPNDVGAFDKGHYMMFYIREQNRTGIPAGLQANKDAEIPGLGPNGAKEGAQRYWNIRSGSEISSKITSGANQIKSATGDLGSSFTSKISSFTGGGGKLGGFDTGSITSSLGSFGNKVKGGLGSIFGETSVLKASPTSTSATMKTNVKQITGSRFINTTTRTKESIALYMPDTLMYNHTQTYSSISMGKGLVGGLFAAGRSALEEYKASIQGGDDMGDSLKKAGIDAVGNVANSASVAGIQAIGNKLSSGMGTGLALGMLGQIQNPMLEMAYTSPNFRKFQFDFFFYPRDESEAMQVQNILDRFKYHQAPEFGAGIDKKISATLRPPSEFDIKFYYGHGENPNIPQIAEGCVLETIDVNYAPNGASFYEVPGENLPKLGRTGMPVGVQLTLNFTETTVLTKKDLRDPSSGGKK
jgi:hypothetical protein